MLDHYNPEMIPCDRILMDSGFNCRGTITFESVKPLADDIGRRGLDTPITVQPASDIPGGLPDHDYRLVAGHRRFQAITVFLHWAEIPAFVRTGLTDYDARVLNFSENLQRKNLNPLEEALALSRLFEAGTSFRQIAKEIQKDHNWVFQRLRILNLPEKVQQLVAAKRVVVADLPIIFQGQTEQQQIELAREIADSKRGPGKNRVWRGKKLVRKLRRNLHVSEMDELLKELASRGIEHNLVFRAIACCAGCISIEEFLEDLDANS